MESGWRCSGLSHAKAHTHVIVKIERCVFLCFRRFHPVYT